MPRKPQPQFVGDFLDFLQVGADFHAGLVDGFQRGAGKLQLPGRFQGDRGAVAGQRDHAALFLHRFPAEPGQSLQQRLDAALAVELRRTQIIQAETELLVLGADAPVRARFLAAGDVLHELRAIGDQRIGDVAGAGQRWTRTAGNDDVGLRRRRHKGGNIACRPSRHHRHRPHCSVPRLCWPLPARPRVALRLPCRHAPPSSASPRPPSRTPPHQPGRLAARRGPGRQRRHRIGGRHRGRCRRQRCVGRNHSDDRRRGRGRRRDVDGGRRICVGSVTSRHRSGGSRHRETRTACRARPRTRRTHPDLRAARTRTRARPPGRRTTHRP